MSALLIISGIILFLVLLAAGLPKYYAVTVSETINRPKDEVMHYIGLFGNQMQYSEWLKADPDLKPEISGIDGTVGSVMRWESQNPDKKKNVGKGEQEIKSRDNENIDVELRLLNPMPAVCQLKNRFMEPEPGKTLYMCTFQAHARFPLNPPAYLIGRPFIRKTQQKTLRNVKAILEQERKTERF